MTQLTRRRFLAAGPAGLSVTALSSLAALAAQPDNASPGAKGSATAIEAVLRTMESQDPAVRNVAPEEGRFLNLLLKTMRARSVLEIGTSYGYTLLWLAEAMRVNGGGITTIEIKPERLEQAKENATRAQVSDRITFLEGDAHDKLRELSGPFDVAVIDADKGGLQDYFDQLHPNRLRPGGLIIAHEAIQMREWMEDYLTRIRSRSDYSTVIVSVTLEDGFALSYRHES